MEGQSRRLLDRFRANLRRERIIGNFSRQREIIRFEMDLQCAITMILDVSMGGDISIQRRRVLLSFLFNQISSTSQNSIAIQQELHLHLAVLIEKKFNKFTHFQKAVLLATLERLTQLNLYCRATLANRKKFFDVLMNQAENLQLDEYDQLQLLKVIFQLLLNISTKDNNYFKLYLFESGWTTIIIRQVSNAQEIINLRRPINYSGFMKNLRFITVKLFKSVILGLEQKHKSGEAINLVKQVLQDEQYFEEEPGWMLLLLTEGMRIENLWVEILGQSEGVSKQILRGIEKIQVRCFSEEFLQNKNENLTIEQRLNFMCLLSFYIELYYVRESFEETVLDWQLAVQNFLNGFMLAQSLIEARKNNQKERINLALQTYSLLAQGQFVSAEQLLAIRPADHSDMLLHIWTDPEVLKGKEGHYCLRILQRLVKSDGQKWYQRLMELKVVMTLEEIINQNKSQVCLLLYEAMDLLLMLCAVNDEGSVLKMFENEELSETLNKLSNGMCRRVKLAHDLIKKSELKNKSLAQRIKQL